VCMRSTEGLFWGQEFPQFRVIIVKATGLILESRYAVGGGKDKVEKIKQETIDSSSDALGFMKETREDRGVVVLLTV